MSRKSLKNFRRNRACRLCRSKNLSKVIDLGKTPLANSFNKSKNKKELMVPLAVDFCKSCYHLQLTHIVNSKKMFDNYLYVTGTSNVTINHFKSYSKDLKRIFKFQKKVKIIDIASNDGTFLNNFKSKKFEAFGIDPAKNLNNNIKNKKLNILTGYFSNKKGDEINKKYGKFDVITANNVFAHVDNLIDFSKGIKKIIKKNGVFVFEVSYLIDVLKKNTFDTIYHEHMSFHSLLPLEKFFNKLEMKIFDFKRSDVQGGSIRFYVCNKNSRYNINKKINVLKENEIKNYKVNKIKTYKKMQKNILIKKLRVKNDILSKIKKGNRLIGYGAAAKTTTLLNFFGINKKHFQFIVDDNPLKQNRFTPGTKIPIKNSKFIYTQKVDYIYILSWNFSKSIIDRHKNFLKKGKRFINIHKI